MFETIKRSRVRKTVPIEGVPHYQYLGVDLGERNDYTAIAVIEGVPVHRKIVEESGRKHVEATVLYRCLRLERPDLGTAYPVIADRIADLCVTLSENSGSKVSLCVDVVGPGAGFKDFLVEHYRDAAKGTGAFMKPAWIWTTHAGTPNYDGQKLNVPRADLVSAGTVAIEDGRYEVAKMPLRETLQNEMRTFAIKRTNAGSERFEHYREDDKDDLVTAAILLPVWVGEKFHKPAIERKFKPEETADPTVFDDTPAPARSSPLLGTPLPPLP
jgi:hypothetical protein